MSESTTTGTAAGGGQGGGVGANSPWGWLGLLKWSLAYSDGTRPTSFSPMSAEDKAFLEKVMSEGIIDENQRMKEILQQVTEGLEEMRGRAASTTTTTTTSTTEDNNRNKDDHNQEEETEGEIQDLLQELRDIVEQIDYARAFAAMKGLPFLLGCVSQPEVPKSIQTSCLGVLATMASNNPPIQKQLLEMGAIRTLSDVFETNYYNTNDASAVLFCAKIMQALSATVRSDELAEQVFCGVEQARRILFLGLQQQHNNNNDNDSSEVLQKRTLFFLRALITSDYSTRERVRLFAHSVAYVADHFVLTPPPMTTADENVATTEPSSSNNHNSNTTSSSSAVSAELREMGLALLLQILEQRKSVNTVLDRKDALVRQGIQRVAALRALTGEERDYASVELESWETLLVKLARASPDSDDNDNNNDNGEAEGQGPALMLAAPIPNPEVAPQ